MPEPLSPTNGTRRCSELSHHEGIDHRTLTFQGTLVAIQLDVSPKAKLDLHPMVRRCPPALLDHFQ